MKKTLFKTFILTFTLLLASCASVKPVNDLSLVYVTNTHPINLLPPEDMGNPIESVHLLSGSFGKESFSVLTYVSADESGIYLTLLNDFGTEMGELVYDGVSCTLNSPVFPSNIKPEYIVADFQNAFYLASKVQENMEKSGLRFELTRTENSEIRKIFNKNKLIEEIYIENNSVLIRNNLRGYSYNLMESLD